MRRRPAGSRRGAHPSFESPPVFRYMLQPFRSGIHVNEKKVSTSLEVDTLNTLARPLELAKVYDYVMLYRHYIT